MRRLALLATDAAEIEDVLGVAAPLEQGCFLLFRGSEGVAGERFVGIDPILPPPGAWEVQEQGQLRPTAQWLSAVVSRAIEAEAGLMFIHSHPDGRHPPGFSPIDRSSIAALAATIGSMLDGPFGAAVVSPSGWAGAVVQDGVFLYLDRITAVGRTLRQLTPRRAVSRPPRLPGLDDRQRAALGSTHDDLAVLHVGVVGVGGLGSPLAEQLVRMGVGSVMLVDHDTLDTPSNLRRVFGSRASDLDEPAPPAKVDVVGRHLESLGLTTRVVRVQGDVRDWQIARSLLDCDVIVAATDTHGSRAALNDVAAGHLVPMIDVGVRSGVKTSGALAALTAEVRVVTPATPCLWCRDAISADVIRTENMRPELRDQLVAEGYAVGRMGEPEPSVVALTVLGSALASCALLSLLSDEGEACPSGYVVDGLFGDSFETKPREPVSGCRCRGLLGVAPGTDDRHHLQT